MVLMTFSRRSLAVFIIATALSGFAEGQDSLVQSVDADKHVLERTAERTQEQSNGAGQELRNLKMNAMRRERESLNRTLQQAQPVVSEYAIVDELERDPKYYQLNLQIRELKDELGRLSEFVRPNSRQLTVLDKEIGRLERKQSSLRKELEPRVIAGLLVSDHDRQTTQLKQQLLLNLAAQAEQNEGRLAARWSQRQRHMRAAIKHLRLAGLHEVVVQLETGASAIQESSQSRFSRNQQDEVARLRIEVNAIREEVREIRNLLKETTKSGAGVGLAEESLRSD